MPLENGAFGENWTNLNRDSMAQAWRGSRDFDRFVKILRLQYQVTAHRFFRLCEGPVHDKPPITSGDSAALRAERLASFDLAPFAQPIEPGHGLVHSVLKLVGGETSVPVRSAE